MKTSSLSKNFKTLLLSLAVSDLGVGLLAQPMLAAYIMDSKQNNETMNKSYNAIYNGFDTLTNIFISASLFSVTALCADRYLAIYLHLRYQELVTYKRVTIAVTSIWVFSALTSLFRFWIPRNILFVYYAIRNFSCIITATSLSVKLKQTLRRHIINPHSNPARNAKSPSRKCSKKQEICDGIALRVSGFHSLLFT